MNRQINLLYVILIFTLLARVFAMITFPLADTTEARYAHTAYLMFITNDWITPYFDLDVPFWGKPPLSFWAEALSYKIFGVYDFVPRVPSLIVTIMTMGLIYKYLITFYKKLVAVWGVVLYSSFVVVYILSGAVIIDPFLVFSTTLAMVSFIMVIYNQKSYWKYLFFTALGLGMLTKGPLVFVLVGGALTFWILFDFKNRFNELRKFPWFSGLLLSAIISLPWYIIAELKTPGFIEYFIVGEHYKRFVDSGWSGDLYGTAHKKPYGMIWFMWFQAAFPASLLVIYLLIKNNSSVKKFSNTFRLLKENSEVSYFIMWSIFTMVFFTMSGNVLTTYILPALPALAIILAIYLEKQRYEIKLFKYNFLYVYILLIPLLSVVANIYLLNKFDTLKTEKYLIAHYLSLAKENEQIYYIHKRPFSAEYYSKDKAIVVVAKQDKKRKKHNSVTVKSFQNIVRTSETSIFVAMRSSDIGRIQKVIKKPMTNIYVGSRYSLFKVE